MLAIEIAGLFLLESQYTSQVRRERGPVGVGPGLDPGHLGQRRRARCLRHQTGRQPDRPIMLPSGEAQEGRIVGAGLTAAGIFQQPARLG